MEQKHLYIIGVGGVGTIWIVDWALKNGWKVSGSDLSESAETTRLAGLGANIHYGSDPSLIPDDITEAIITSAITPSAQSYPEYEELLKREIPVQKRAQWIGKLTKTHFTIGVSGTHGKTTTTAMIGWILDKAGYDPTVFVGGVVRQWGATKIGQSNILVIEADEYDRSFHNFYPQMAVVLNIDADHLDYYKDGIGEIERSFKHFLRKLPARYEETVQNKLVLGHKKGLVVGHNEPRIRKICKGFVYKFRWYSNKEFFPGLKLLIPGEHNMLNATAAAKIAHEMGISTKVIQDALATFPGVGRRFEFVGTWKNGALFYDDYAHHPKELAATLQGVAEKFAGKKVTIVFQPHQKARTLSLLAEFGRCFDANPPYRLILAPIYQVAGREADLEVTSEDVEKEIAKKMPTGMLLSTASDNSVLETLVKEALLDTDVIMSVGAGSVRSLMEKWLEEEK